MTTAWTESLRDMLATFCNVEATELIDCLRKHLGREDRDAIRAAFKVQLTNAIIGRLVLNPIDFERLTGHDVATVDDVRAVLREVCDDVFLGETQPAPRPWPASTSEYRLKCPSAPSRLRLMHHPN